MPISVEVADAIDASPNVRLCLQQHFHEDTVVDTALLSLKILENFHHFAQQPLAAQFVEPLAIKVR